MPSLAIPQSLPRSVPRSRRALITAGVVLLVVLIVARLAVMAARSSATPAPEPAQLAIEVPAAVLAAHGLVQPIARANLGSLAGGTIAELNVQIGQEVDKGQVVARMSGPSQNELVVSPLHGTVTSLPVHVGDSLTPGAALMTIADASRYRVETSDVDEYLITRIRTQQPVTVTLDALPGKTLRGTVLSISPTAQTLPNGGLHYPVTIDIPAAAPELRPGMTAHVTFEQ